MGSAALSCQTLAADVNSDTHDNFFATWRSFSWPDPPQISHRLYHDDQGRPQFYSMEDLPGTYIEVDAATYAEAPHDVVVRDGRLIRLEPRVVVHKLCPDTDQGTCCHPSSICVVVSPDLAHKKWKKKTYDAG